MSTMEWHTNDIRIHTNDIRITYEYIRPPTHNIELFLAIFNP